METKMLSPNEEIKKQTATNKISAKITIKAPIDIVWNRIKEFNDLSWTGDGVKSSVMIRNAPVEVGNKRNVIFYYKDKEVHIIEPLISYQNDENVRSYTYGMESSLDSDIGFNPQNYQSTLSVSKVEDNTCEVVWKATFECEKDNENLPIFIQEKIFQSGLECLKTKVEQVQFMQSLPRPLSYLYSLMLRSSDYVSKY